MTTNSYILSFKCPDGFGVVAKATHIFLERSAFISEISNYSDPVSKTFFLRCVFDDREAEFSYSAFVTDLEKLAKELKMTFSLRARNKQIRTLIAVSKEDHCLSSILSKWKRKSLNIDITGVVSNHIQCKDLVEWHGLEFHYLPIVDGKKSVQERQLLSLFKNTQSDLLVLARYMQILSPNACEVLNQKCVNIHHSFLPSFKGANPYQQAYDRGVKVIGATAHFVTTDLDDGPIIAQNVRHIDHELTVQQMKHLGHDTESSTLTQAIELICNDRVIVNGARTVIL